MEGIGIDVAEIGRFRSLIKQKKQHLLDKMFSNIEREYCFSFKDAAPHLAGTFAAKEAVIKAGGSPSLTAVEIRRGKDGRPEVWCGGRKSKSLIISISHSSEIACAIALQK